MSSKTIKGYSIYPREGRPKWYVCYFSAEEFRWVSRVTPYRRDDHGGYRKAVMHGEALARKFMSLAKVDRSQVWTAWVSDHLSQRYQGRVLTHRRYSTAWSWLQTWLHERNLIQPAAIQYQHAQEYMDWRLRQLRACGRAVNRNTVLVELKVLASLMREAVRRGYAVSNPIERLGLARERPKEKPELSDDEIAKVRAEVARREAAKPVTERWMTVSFEIALHQGCRLTETSLPLERIDERLGTIQFHGKGRNGEPNVYTTALHPALLPLITDLRKAGATHTCHLPQMAAKEWWKLRRAIGLEHTTFHSTRVTAITRLARAGVPLSKAMRFVGHADEAVHRIYQRIKLDDLGACLAALDYSGSAQAAGPAVTENKPG